MDCEQGPSTNDFSVQHTPTKTQKLNDGSKGFAMLSPSTTHITKGTNGRWSVGRHSLAGGATSANQQAARQLLALAKSPQRHRARPLGQNGDPASTVTPVPQSNASRMFSRTLTFQPTNIQVADPSINRSIINTNSSKKILLHANNQSIQTATKNIARNDQHDFFDRSEDNPSPMPVMSRRDVQMETKHMKRQSRKRTKAQKAADGLEAMWTNNENEELKAACRAVIGALKSGFGMHQDRHRKFLITLRELHEKDELMDVNKSYKELCNALIGSLNSTCTTDQSAPSTSTVPNNPQPLMRFVRLFSLFLSAGDAARFGCFHERACQMKAWTLLCMTKKYVESTNARNQAKKMMNKLKKLAHENEADTLAGIEAQFGGDSIIYQQLCTLFPNQKCTQIPPAECFEDLTMDCLNEFVSLNGPCPNQSTIDEKSEMKTDQSAESSSNNEVTVAAVQAKPTKSTAIFFERVHVPYISRTYASYRSVCDCGCHKDMTLSDTNVLDKCVTISQQNIAMKHCPSCQVKFVNGHPMILSSVTNKWCPATVTYSNPVKVEQDANPKDLLLESDSMKLTDIQPMWSDCLPNGLAGLVTNERLLQAGTENSVMQKLYSLVDGLDTMDDQASLSILGAAMRELEETRDTTDMHTEFGTAQPWTQQEDSDLLDLIDRLQVRAVSEAKQVALQSIRDTNTLRSVQQITSRVELLLEKLLQFDQLAALENH